MRVAYVVSRFPEVSQTFVVRELNAVEGRDGVEIELFSLFPPIDATLHPAAGRWAERLRRPSLTEAARSLAWWLVRRPRRLLASIGRVAAAHARRPRVLVRALATVPLAAALARELRRLGVDHVHAHFASYPALSAWLSWRLTGIPYSFTGHAHDLFMHQAFLRRKLRDARFAVVISEFNREFLRRSRLSDGTPVHVVHCGVDLRRYPFRPRSPSPPAGVSAACVARLEEKKGHRVLLDALAAGGPELEGLELDLVGDGELRPPLERQVEALGLRGRVRFRGSLPEEEVSTLLEHADLFVLPSIRTREGEMEGIPVSLMEALAAGLPTVATRLSGVPELVRDGVTGLLAEPGSADSLRAALVRMLGSPAAAAAMGTAGHHLVREEFAIEVTGRQMVDLFHQVGKGADRREKALERAR